MKPRRLSVLFNRPGRALAGRRGFTNYSSQGFGRGAHTKALLALAAIVAVALVLGVSLAAGAAPTVTIENASNVEYTTAHVEGEVDPSTHETSYHFEAATQAQFTASEWAEATQQGFGSLPEGAGLTPVEATLEGLAPATTYHLRLVAENEEGPSEAVAATTFTTKVVAKPSVSVEAVTTFTGTTATFSGHVNPNAPEAAPTSGPVEAAFESHWHFQCSPECPGLEGTVAADNTAHAVEAHATGLLPGTTYEVSLVAENAGGEESAGPVSFTTPAVGPTITSTFPTGVTGPAATLNAKVKPGGAATTVHFQYLTAQQFEADGNSFGAGTEETAPSSIGSDNEAHEASATITSLTANTNYRFRVVATNSAAPSGVGGPAQPLYTYSAPAFSGCGNEALRSENLSLALPDCRAYEAVSPLNAPDDVYAPIGPYNNQESGTIESSASPFQASPSGTAATYVGDPLASGGTGARGNGHGNEFLATRTPAGWQAQNIQLTAEGETASEAQQTRYQAFLFSLDLGVFSAFSQPLAASAQPQAPLTCGDHSTSALYTRSADATHHALFIATQAPGECGHPLFAAASADGSQFFFQTEAALTPAAVEDPPGSVVVPCSHDCNLYDSVTGHLSSLNLLPGGVAAPHATFGAPPLNGSSEGEEPNFSHAVSADGSRAYWTDEESGVLYLRRNPTSSSENCAIASDACTVRVSAAGTARFWIATPDGRYAYYTEAGALWRFDATSSSSQELVAAGEEVQGVLGINEEGEDGSFLYFVAGGALPGTGATARVCNPAGNNTPEEERERNEEEAAELPAHHGCNLYLLHAGAAKLISTLAPLDNHQPVANLPSFSGVQGGDWRPALGRRTAQPSADGHSLAFQSILPLTGYNISGLSGSNGQNGSEFSEAFVYDADANSGSGQLSCASCSPAGEPPIKFNGTGTLLPVSTGATYMRRWLSANGARVFFDTKQPLLPSDHNRQFDVYEWERPGTATCAAGSVLNGGACLYLLSSGRAGSTSTDSQSFFTDASGDGSHAFFMTRAPLLPGAVETMKLYDAHENGGFPPSLQLTVCESDGCKGPTASPPASTSPGTSTFAGPGNPPSPTCRKGFVRKHGKCVKKHHNHKHHKANKHHSKRPAKANRGGAK